MCIFAVTPLTGVRIEIKGMLCERCLAKVTPLTGVRIEIDSVARPVSGSVSHPPHGGEN